MAVDTTPARKEGGELLADKANPASGRSIASLTKLEKAWLRRARCGWCQAPGTATRCQEMYTDDPCDMDVQRAIWLSSYKPRALSPARLQEEDK